jgi:ABC-type Zn uptake system ZnuABC Zn-binding protein ZnuA
MKRLFALLGIILLLLPGCTARQENATIAATTRPVYEFTLRLCEGTDITVTLLVTEPVSCLHDYSLNVNQVRAVEAAELVAISGAGLEEFMEDLLKNRDVIDCSAGVPLAQCAEEHNHDHDHHHHEADSHIWLAPESAKIMATNICNGLCARFPQYRATFEANLTDLLADLDALQVYGEETLAQLSCRELVTFHDGFSYFAEAFDLTILEAVEEESGSEASAQELKHLISIVREHDLPAIFTETNGSASAAVVIARETGVSIGTLDMAMGEKSYFEAMYHNIDTIKEVLG